jgi:hypothetical protein
VDREEIIRMAREAGLAYGSDEKPLGSVIRFAALVAAHEREACAKVCADIAAHREVGAYGMLVAHSCANEILARNEK